MLYNRKDICVVSCKDGCDETLIARNFDGTIFLSFLSGDFYTNQSNFDSIKLAVKLLKGKKLLKEVLCNAEDLYALRDFLASATYEGETAEDKKYKEDSHLCISWDEDFGYSLNLISDQKRWKAAKLKNFRMFDIYLTEEDRDLLVRRINCSLKKHEKNYRKYIEIS